MNLNVPHFYHSWKEGGKLVIKMEYCHSDLGKQLASRKKYKRIFGEAELLQITIDILGTLHKLHELNYAHMDIKPGSQG